MDNNTNEIVPQKEQKWKNFIPKGMQKFYFNQDGKLVIETSKGYMCDGNASIRLNGLFACDEVTMQALAKQLTGVTVEVDDGKIPHVEASAVLEALEKDLKKDYAEAVKNIEEAFSEIIKHHNSLPWYKRIKKIQVKVFKS